MILSETLLQQTRLHFPTFENEEVKISLIEKGGSGRKFYRIQFSPNQSVVLVKYTREQMENQRYVEIAELLEKHHVRAPKIHFHDPNEGLIWVEDLGEHDLWSHRDEPWPARRPLYHSALEEVAKLHRISEADSARFRSHLPAQFDASLYLWEQHYFFDHCLGRHFQVAEQERTRLMALPRLAEIAEQLGAYSRVLVHRDFQSQNVIIRNRHAYLIDFQGMRPGLAEYDLASLLYDPYVSLTADERTELLNFYCTQTDGGEPDLSLKFQLCAMQRLMQALGAYGFLGLVQNKKEFLDHIPGAMTSLGKVLQEIDGLQSLTSLVESLVS